MQISISYARQSDQYWESLQVEEGCTVQQAIERCGILDKFTHLDLQEQTVGIFGKKAKLDAPLQEGDRVEIYHAITVDPDTVERRDE